MFVCPNFLSFIVMFFNLHSTIKATPPVNVTHIVLESKLHFYLRTVTQQSDLKTKGKKETAWHLARNSAYTFVLFDTR